MLTKERLLEIFPLAAKTPLGVDTLVNALNPVLVKLGSKNRAAGFIAQTGHESASFTRFVENLNYSGEGLVKTFKKYFPNLPATLNYARKPDKIANKVYANRMGNGSEGYGDGWKFRGRGLMQCTGRNNYMACGTYLGLDLINRPELLEQLPGAVDSALWYWITNDLNKSADADDIKLMTYIINRGDNGLKERTEKYTLAKSVLE